ncbi:MAG TPA: hypothetical protein VGR22_04790 [Thermomicrobiales bacterium]|nr:hypothetical protein [Thermomicrobiales bacterium]
MQYQQRPPTSFISQQLRGVINGFLAGLVTGVLIGWFFHGFVGLLVRFGFVLILLIPLAFVVWYFFLRGGGRSPVGERGDGMQVFTWRSGEGPRRFTVDLPHTPSEGEPERRHRRTQTDDETIDSEFRELKRRVDRDE